MSSYPIVLKDEFSTVIFLCQRIPHCVRSVLALPIETLMVRNTATRLYNTKRFALWRLVPKEHKTVAGMNVISPLRFRLRMSHSEDGGDGIITCGRPLYGSGK